MAERTIVLNIKRQDSPRVREPYWQEFEIPYQDRSQRHLDADGDPPQSGDARRQARIGAGGSDANCLEEVCGACTMVINGRVRQALHRAGDQSAEQPITLEPMTKFPTIRDLWVDRSRDVRGASSARESWIPIDGSYDLGPGPRISRRDAAVRLPASRDA